MFAFIYAMPPRHHRPQASAGCLRSPPRTIPMVGCGGDQAVHVMPSVMPLTIASVGRYSCKLGKITAAAAM
jgi:hypothetical protein